MMTFAEYVNKNHSAKNLTPYQITMIHAISSKEKTIFSFSHAMGKTTVISLLNEYQEYERAELAALESVPKQDDSN
jgi:hypothetical protein